MIHLFFLEIRENSVNVHGKPGVSTQQTPIGFNRDDMESVTGPNKHWYREVETPKIPDFAPINGGVLDMSDTLIIFGADGFSHGATENIPRPGVVAIPTSHRAFSDSAFAGGA